MGLNLNNDESLFQHNRDFQEGVAERGIRPGQATIVVALDGSGDAETIQEGINMLPDIGGVVYIKEGTYLLTATVEVTKDNVSLIGAGKSTKIQMDIDDQMISLVGRSGILIKQLFIYGAGAGNANNEGILTRTSNCSDCTVTECWVENCGSVGIYSSRSGDSGMIFSNNHVTTCVSTGIHLSGTDSVINGNVVSANIGHGIFVDGDNNSVTGNISSGATGAAKSGIRKEGFGKRCTFVGNTCNSNTDYGIEIDDGTSCIVIGNTCLSNTTGQIADGGVNTLPNGAVGTNNLALDDLNIIA